MMELQPKLGLPVKEGDHLHYIPAPKADKLYSQVLAQIDHLPTELLVQIFQLCIHASLIAFPGCDVHRHLKRRLASVSRRWRDIILNSAKFWTTIKLAPTWSKSLVKAHLARSSQLSLNIEICDPQPRDITATHTLLDLLISCSHRWCSVVVRNNVADAQLVGLLSRMKHKTFSSLSHFSVGYMPGWLSNNWVATQLCTKQFPWLEHLGLGGPFEPSLAGRVPPNLTSLMLRLDDLGPSCTIQDLLLQKLTSLTLSGRADFLPLHPSSIQLPLLEKLVCKATDGDVLINAIMAPNLLHLEYSTGEWIGLSNNRWNLRTPKYPNVTNLVLPLCGIHGSNKHSRQSPEKTPPNLAFGFTMGEKFE